MVMQVLYNGSFVSVETAIRLKKLEEDKKKDLKDFTPEEEQEVAEILVEANTKTEEPKEEEEEEDPKTDADEKIRLKQLLKDAGVVVRGNPCLNTLQKMCQLNNVIM